MDELVTWLRDVLQRRAGAIDRFERLSTERHMGADTLDHVAAARMGAMGWTVDGERARVAAERELLEAYVNGDLDRYALADVLKWLAWSHRFDLPGWSTQWAPIGAAAVS